MLMLCSALALAGCGGADAGKSSTSRGQSPGKATAGVATSGAPGAAASDVPDPGKVPKAVAPETTHDFGTIELGEEKVYTFAIRNEGTAPLKLVKGEPGCKCTKFQLGSLPVEEKELEVPPGESTNVTVTFRIDKPMESELFEQAAPVETNDPEKGEIRLTVKGLLAQLFIIRPSRTWDIGDFKAKDSPRAEGTIVSPVLDEFEINEIWSQMPDNLKISSTPLEKEELEKLEAKSGYKLVATIEGDTALGQYSSYFEVRTPARDGIKIPIVVKWRRTGPLKIYGLGSKWIEELNLLKLDKFPAVDGKTGKLALFVDEGGAPLKMEAVEADPNWLEVKLEPDVKFKGNGKSQKYTLTITVPPGKQPAARNAADNTATVRIKTNHPDIGTFEIKVSYFSL